MCADLAVAAVLDEQVRQVYSRLRSGHGRSSTERQCGNIAVAEFGAEATASTCYGPGFAAVGVDLLQPCRAGELIEKHDIAF